MFDLIIYGLLSFWCVWMVQYNIENYKVVKHVKGFIAFWVVSFVYDVKLFIMSIDKLFGG